MNSVYRCSWFVLLLCFDQHPYIMYIVMQFSLIARMVHSLTLLSI